MPTLQQSLDVDLESANCKDGVADGGGGSGRRRVAAGYEGGGSPLSSGAANEIVENSGGNDKDKEDRRDSNVSDCSVEIVDLESRSPETKDLDKTARDCRICHLSMDGTNQDSGTPIELGCSCKDDLAAAHKQCAEAWFKIKGDKTCEICGSIAQNVTGVPEGELPNQWDDQALDARGTAAPSIGSSPLTESRNFWQGHRFLNFLLACMVFAFVVSWLFHFNVPS